jgi:integrase
MIPSLGKRLSLYRERCGNPQQGPMFQNTLGGRLNLNNLLAQVMLPALNRRLHCGGEPGKSHLREHHDFKRDPSIPRWQGWHAARRGVASNLYSLGVSDKVIQRILRHSNVNVTMTHYVKPMDADVTGAMAKLEAQLAQKNGLEYSGSTVMGPAPADPELIN